MLVRDLTTLSNFCQHAQEQPDCAVDTEFVWTKTYWPQLALIQLATPTELLVVDMLELGAPDCLRQLLTAPDTVKVFHAADQDLRLLYQHFDRMLVGPFWDSQIGAALAGYDYQIGYGRLVQQSLDITLDKTSQFTDWLQRPLLPEQLSYAADDVRYLIELFPRLRVQLVDLQRWQWSLEDCQRMLRDIQLEPLPPEQAFTNVRGHNRLHGAEHYALRRLAHWREQQAMQLDLRPRHVIPDPVLLQLAGGRNISAHHWHKVNSSIQRRAKEYLPTLTAMAEQARQQAENMHVSKQKSRMPTAVERDAKAAADALLDRIAADLGIDRSVVATQSDVTSMIMALSQAHDLEDNRLVNGWRGELFGPSLVDCIKTHFQI